MKKHILSILFVLFFSLWSISAIFKPGMMQTHDGLWQVQRASAMYETLKQGQFPARFVHKLDNDYGIPLFNFIYPGPYYLSSLPMALGVVNITSIKLVVIFAYLTGSLGIYALFHKSRFIALVSAMLYAINPYVLVNIFVRGAVGESLVIGLAPWVFLSLQSFTKRAVRWYDPLALALALISHNFLGLLLAAMILVYGISLKVFKKTVLYLLLSLGLSAFFLIPMIMERSYLLSSATGNFTFVWSDHFIYPFQLLYSKWDYWFSMPGYLQDGMTFQLGFANILILVVYLIWYLLSLKSFKKEEKISYGFFLLAASALILAMIPAGRFIWELFPILQTMQFPWRLLGLMTIVVGVMTGVLLSYRVKKHRLSTIVFALILLFTALINTRNYHRPMKTLTAEEFRIENDLYAGKATTSIRSEVVPRWAPIERYQPMSLRLFNPRLGILDGNAEINTATDLPGNLTFKATAENERASAVYYHNYYPSWRATIDGQPLEIIPTPTGEISIKLTQGVHEYRIYLASTPYSILGNVVSLISLFIVIVMGLISFKGSRHVQN